MNDRRGRCTKFRSLSTSSKRGPIFRKKLTEVCKVFCADALFPISSENDPRGILCEASIYFYFGLAKALLRNSILICHDNSSCVSLTASGRQSYKFRLPPVEPFTKAIQNICTRTRIERLRFPELNLRGLVPLRINMGLLLLDMVVLIHLQMDLGLSTRMLPLLCSDFYLLLEFNPRFKCFKISSTMP